MENDSNPNESSEARNIGRVESVFGRVVYAATIVTVGLGAAAVAGAATDQLLSAAGTANSDYLSAIVAIGTFAAILILGTVGWLRKIDHQYWN